MLLLVVLPSRLSNNPMLCSVTCLWMCERVRERYIQRPRGDLRSGSIVNVETNRVEYKNNMEKYLSAASSKQRFIYLADLLLHAARYGNRDNFYRVKNDSGVRGRAFSETLAGWQKSCRQVDSEILRLWYSRWD